MAAAAGSAGAEPATLSKEALKGALLDLVGDDAFLTLLHARYMQTLARSRAAAAAAARSSS